MYFYFSNCLGPHIQADEKRQLSTFPSLQLVPGPANGQEESECFCQLSVFCTCLPQVPSAGSSAAQVLLYIRALIRQRSRFQLRQLITSVLKEIIKCNAASVERWHTCISKQLSSKH